MLCYSHAKFHFLLYPIVPCSTNGGKNPGIVFDSFLHFFSHASCISQKVRSRNKVLKALACTSYEQGYYCSDV